VSQRREREWLKMEIRKEEKGKAARSEVKGGERNSSKVTPPENSIWGDKKEPWLRRGG